MAQNYTRQSSFADGDTITAALFNNEFNQVVNAFSYSASSDSSTGHKHDGTTGQGGNIPQIGDIDFLNKIVVDNTNNRWGFYVQVSSGTVEQLRIQDGAIVPVTDDDIDLGTSSLEFKDLFLDGTAHIDTLDVDVNATVAGTLGVTGATTLSSTLGVTGATTLSSTLGVTGAITGSSTLQATTITATTAFVPDASDGASLGTTSLEFSDLYLADGALIAFGDDQDVTLTHVADTGLLLNSTMALQFNDASQYINAPSATVLDINATDEIELNATLVDVNANLDVSGTVTATGTSVFASLDISGDIDVDGTANLDVVDIDGAVDMATTLTVAGNVDFNGDLDVDGTTNLDVVDIDGAVQADGTITVGVDDTGYDVKFFGATTGKSLLWDESADTLIVTGDSTVSGTLGVTGVLTATSLDISGDIDVDGTTNLDVVDIDGAVDMASTLAVGGVVTANAGVVVDTMTLDAATLTATGDFTVDAVGDIILDADTAVWRFKDAGTTLYQIAVDGASVVLYTGVSDADMVFKGNDGGSTVTALTLDMSEAGAATFNSTLAATELNVSQSSNSNHSYKLLQGYGYTVGGNYYGQYAIGTSYNSAENTGTLEFFTGSGSSAPTEAMRIDASGNVGIGTSSPVRPLSVKASQEQLTLSEGDTRGATFDYRSSTGNLNIATNGINARTNPQFTLDLNGNVGIGNSSPTDTLHLGTSSGATQLKIQSGSGINNCILHTNGTTDSWRTGINLSLTDGSYEFYDDVNNVSRMVIDASGNLNVSRSAYTSASTNGFHANADGWTHTSASGEPTAYFNRNTSDGDVVRILKDGATVGSIQAVGGDLNIGTGDTALLFVDSLDAILPATTANPAAATRDNAIDLGRAATRFKDLYLSGVSYNGDGSATAPSISFGADTNTGFYRVGSDQIGFVTAGTIKAKLDASGRVTMPYQPAFQVVAVPQNNIPINANTTVTFSNEVFDQGSNYSGSVFTAPVTGKYQLNLALYTLALDSAADYVQIAMVTSNRSYYAIVDPGVWTGDPTYWSFAITVLADMDASDTAHVEVQLNNTGAAQMDITANSAFSGYLVA